jgi:hypothetical protein
LRLLRDTRRDGPTGPEDFAGVEIKGSILAYPTGEEAIEKLYFDGPGSEDWPAFAHYKGMLVPALSLDNIFLSAS